MRRITLAIVSTISAVVLLLSYRTSTDSVAAADPKLAATARATASSSRSAGTVTPSSNSTATASTSSSSATSSSASTLTDGTFTGNSVSTQWGAVQVQVTVKNGVITAAEALSYPSGNDHDQKINAYAIPILNAEVTQAQSASIDTVSGATVTSDGYLESLQSAIDQARK